MPDPRVFPRLDHSPTSRCDSAPSADARSHDQGQFRSLPHTPRSPRPSRLPIPGAPHYWAKRRRVRQARIDSILAASKIREHRGAYSRVDVKELQLDLRKQIRTCAREVGWLLSPKSQTKPAKMSPLASAVRSAAIDEDDMIDDYLGSVVDGGLLNGASGAAAEWRLDFDTVHEIVFLRHLVRRMVQQRLEHPDADMRKNAEDFFKRLNAESLKRHIPVPRPIWDGPSFYYPAQKLELSSQLRLADAHHMDDDESSSSSDDDNSDIDGHGSRFAGTNNAAAARGVQHRARRRRGGEASPVSLSLMIRRYTEYVCEQWNNTVPHLFQLLNPLPECGVALVNTLSSIFKVPRSDIREPEAYYLFSTAAAQVACYPLVCMAESRLVASCDDNDPHDYESWVSHGVSAASCRIQLLARFGQKLASKPWDVGAQDVQHLVDEYVRSRSEQPPPSPLTRQRGEGSSPYLQQRVAVHRSLSTSIVSGHPSPVSLCDFPRKSIEESAVRDIVHSVVVMAVAHGLGSFASACGMVPDIDHPAGSYFGDLERLLPVEQAAGPPPCTEWSLASDGVQRQPASQPVRLDSSLVDEAERNTVQLIRCLQQSFLNEHGPEAAFSQPTSHLSSHACQVPPPPSLMLHRLSGTNTKTSTYLSGLKYTDPLENQLPQFAAYRQMRAAKLSKYELPPDSRQQFGDGCADNAPSTAHAGQGHAVGTDSGSPNTGCNSQPSVTAHSQSTPPPQHELAQLPLTRSHPRSWSQPHSPYQSRNARSIHLSQRDDLRWDVLSGYLRQQLSIDEDALGNEVQVARALTGRPLTEPNATASPEDDYGVYLADTTSSPLKADRADPNAARHASDMALEDDANMKPKSCSLASVVSLPGAQPDWHIHLNSGEACHQHTASQPTNTRKFHDAIWHFTLSLYHIYEEYYFYNKYKDETSPDSSQPDIGPAESSSRHPTATGMATLADGVSAVDAVMNIDLDADVANADGQQHSPSPQYSKWLSRELKDHIRAVVRNPSSITGVMAQSPVATGLNLCVAELVHINLIISLAQRQAEIIHGIRAIREYEKTKL